jgi:hypothetical protein
LGVWRSWERRSKDSTGPSDGDGTMASRLFDVLLRTGLSCYDTCPQARTQLRVDHSRRRSISTHVHGIYCFHNHHCNVLDAGVCCAELLQGRAYLDCRPIVADKPSRCGYPCLAYLLSCSSFLTYLGTRLVESASQPCNEMVANTECPMTLSRRHGPSRRSVQTGLTYMCDVRCFAIPRSITRAFH